MSIEAMILELIKLGEKYGYDSVVQVSGCYGSTTQMFYFEHAKIDTDYTQKVVVNIPSDLCSG